MAEFKVVAKELERMCNTYHTAKGKCGTDECPLYCKDLCYAKSMVHVRGDDAGYLEKVVMTWAAEHPEPVYPTWEEWLLDNGVFAPDNVLLNGRRRFYMEGKPVLNIPTEKIYDRIPADIAEKLGIEPKEKE